ncbi:MAG: CdaR family protein [Succiniclasticum sp.]|nr:CdaR family protein [Succiniclasticum sp.]
MNSFMDHQREGKSNNWIPRIICLLLAIFLWVYVMGEQNPITERDVVVSLGQRNLADNMVVFNKPDKISVRVRGPRTALASLTEAQVTAYVNLAKLSAGPHTVLVNAFFPQGEVVDISPRMVSLFVDVRREKIMPVTARILGKPATDVAVSKTQLLPSEVKVTGAATRLDAIEKIEVPVDVSDRSEPFQTTAQPVAVGHDGIDMEDITFDPAQITIRTNLLHEMVTKELPVKAEFTGTLPSGMQKTSSTVNPYKITVSGPPSIVNAMTEVKTDPIDLAAHGNDRSVRVNVSLPESVRADNRTVTVEYTITSDTN